MAANILHSDRAVQMSVFVVRAFVRMRRLLGDTRELAQQLANLEKELKERLDVHEVAIVGILQRVINLIGPAGDSIASAQTNWIQGERKEGCLPCHQALITNHLSSVALPALRTSSLRSKLRRTGSVLSPLRSASAEQGRKAGGGWTSRELGISRYLLPIDGGGYRRG